MTELVEIGDINFDLKPDVPGLAEKLAKRQAFAEKFVKSRQHLKVSTIHK